jgi:hypothetical protein
MHRFSTLPFVFFALMAASSISRGQAVASAADPLPADLVISGPHVFHRGDNLWFTATLTNRSGQVLAVPSTNGGNGWTYMAGPWWKIADRSGKQLKFKPGTECFCDHNIGAVDFQDSDFVLLKPGESIEYKHETLRDPSDKFIFPGEGTFFVTLSWSFCAPRVKLGDNGSVGYICGVTRALSPSIREAVLATPSFDLQSNVWKMSLE